MAEIVIVTYSPKCKTHQCNIRARQVELTEKTISSSGRNRRAKNPNDSARFIKKFSITKAEAITKTYVYDRNQERITEDAWYDRFIP